MVLNALHCAQFFKHSIDCFNLKLPYFSQRIIGFCKKVDKVKLCVLPLTVCLQEPMFPARVVYDLLFFFIVIIIVLNLIFGVIIDTFADLRSEKQRKEEILKTTCFICGTCGIKEEHYKKLSFANRGRLIITELFE